MRGGELILTKLASLAAPLRGEDRNFRKAGDEARDRKDWAAAAEFYHLHLKAEPGDAAIWVQLGHALKEQRLLAEAIRAYSQAVSLLPEDADAQLQYGRALGLHGRRAEAIEAFSKAIQISASVEAQMELMAIGEGDLASEFMQAHSAANSAAAVLFEISDLLDYLQQIPTLTGIQRVQVGIFQFIAKLPPEQLRHYRFVWVKGAEILTIQTNTVERLIRHVTGVKVDLTHVQSLVHEARTTALPMQPVTGQTFVILGGFWTLQDTVRRCARMKEMGLRIGIMIYDLIPITHREYCEATLTNVFIRSLADGLLAFDFMLAISEYVAQNVRDFLQRAGVPPIPIEVVPLAHTLKPVRVTTSRWTKAIEHLRDRPFVLSVATIEARKNHIYLFRAWKEMIEAGDEIPDLVLVGRPGWRIGDFMAQMQDTAYLDGRIHVLHGLSDDELATLYINCHFSAFPSFVEGWGLPVGESLAYGAPCIASQESSIPEVGGDLVDYIDPFNLRDGVAAIRRMLFEEGYREKRKADIAQNFVSRSWDDVGAILLAKLDKLTSSIPVRQRSAAPFFLPGKTFRPADVTVTKQASLSYFRWPLRAVLANGWYDCENWGVWMAGESGDILFRTELEEGRDAFVYLRLRGAPQANGQQLTIRDKSIPLTQKLRDVESESIKSIAVHAEMRRTIRLSVRVKADGIVSIAMDLASPALPNGADTRLFCVGLEQIGWSPADDLLSRQEITEQFLLLS